MVSNKIKHIKMISFTLHECDNILIKIDQETFENIILESESIHE